MMYVRRRRRCSSQIIHQELNDKSQSILRIIFCTHSQCSIYHTITGQPLQVFYVFPPPCRVHFVRVRRQRIPFSSASDFQNYAVMSIQFKTSKNAFIIDRMRRAVLCALNHHQMFCKLICRYLIFRNEY